MLIINFKTYPNNRRFVSTYANSAIEAVMYCFGPVLKNLCSLVHLSVQLVNDFFTADNYSGVTMTSHV